MTTTCQQIYVRAKNSSPANAALLPTPADILARIDAEQQKIFANLSTEQRDRFQTTASVTSTAGASQRVFDLSGITPGVQRVLQLQLSDTRIVNQVDVLDPDAELSPRYIVRGQTLVEVSNDWLIGGAAVVATLTYVYGPTTILPNADFTQVVSIPDAFSDLLVIPLRMDLYYMRDPKDRAPDEYAMMSQALKDTRAAFVSALENFGGIESRRFILPQPSDSGKR